MVKVREKAPAPRETGQKTRTLSLAVLCLILASATILCYLPVSKMPFVQWDDPDYVYENSHVREGLTAGSAAWAFRSMEYANWHPVTWLSHMLDVEMFGLDAGKHHRTNLIIHVINVLLLFFLVLRVTDALRPAALVAGLFALHPLHIESVAWISERKDLLCGMFWFLTILAWLSFAKSRETGWYLLALGAFAAGLMSKPMIVTLPFTLLLLDVWPLGRFPLKAEGFARRAYPLFLEKTPFFLLSAVSSVVAFIAQKTTGAVAPLDAIPLVQRLANAFWAYCSYLVKTVYPSGLAAFYPLARRNFLSPAVITAAVLVVGITVIVVWKREKNPFLAFGWFWYVGTLVPVIGLVQIGGQSMADRYTYIPLTGLFIVAAVAVEKLALRFPAARLAVPAASFLLLLPLFIATRVHLQYWDGDKIMWERAAAVTKKNYVAENNIGSYYLDRGEAKEAYAHFKTATEFNPQYASSWINLGRALAKMGQQQSALESLAKAVELAPRNSEARLEYGKALDGGGRYEEALEHYREALRYNPGSPEILNLIGIALGNLNRLPEAVEWLSKAAEADPPSAKRETDLGVALDHGGRSEEAIEHFRRAIAIDPAYSRSWYNMALALARTGRFTEAADGFREALNIEPDMAEARYYLGVALVKEKRYREAREEFLKLEQSHPDYQQTRANLEKLDAILGPDRP